jgi:hypothetical protein
MLQALIILIAAIALLLATWYAAEWASRRMSSRYEGRKRLWDGFAPDDADDSDSSPSS